MEEKSRISVASGKPRAVTYGRGDAKTVEELQKVCQELIDWMLEDGDNLFIDEFFVKHNYRPGWVALQIKRLRKNGTVEDELSSVMEMYLVAHKIQELKLAKGGLKGDFNPLICKLMLSHHHRYKEFLDNASSGNPVFNQYVTNVSIQNKSAEEIARNYTNLVRGLSSGQPLSLPRPEEIPADIE